jgi:hypothetical protein
MSISVPMVVDKFGKNVWSTQLNLPDSSHNRRRTTITVYFVKRFLISDIFPTILKKIKNECKWEKNQNNRK